MSQCREEKGAKRMTLQRSAILEELRRERFHPTADELYERVRQRFPRISLGTVYRNLQVLVNDGRIRKVESDGKLMRFDGTLDEHQHIRCLSCGRLEDVGFGLKPGLMDSVSAESGYDVTGCAVMFEGLCPDCRKRTAHRAAAVEKPKQRSNEHESSRNSD